MPKPWERYQQAASPKDGPWAKYGKPDFSNVEARSSETVREAEPMGRAESFGTGIMDSIDTTVRGAKQLAVDVGAKIAPVYARPVMEAASQRMAAEEAERRAKQVPNGWRTAGNIIGTVAQIVGPGGVAKLGTQVPSLARAAPALNAFASQFLPSTIRGNALQGAVVGALQPVAEGGSRAANTAITSAFGGVGAAIPRVLGAAATRVRDALPAVGAKAQERAAAQVLNTFAADPAALRIGAMNPQIIVPGSLPTLAEASGDVGLAGLQRTLANTPEFGNALTAHQQANNLARVRAIEAGFGGADETAAAAIREGRDRAAAQILRPIDRLPMTTLNKVVDGVNRLSEKHQAAPAVRAAMDAVKAELPNIRTVGDAHAVRQYIGQLIGGQVEGKAGAKLAKRELLTVQALLDREMKANYPEWGKFLREYKAASREADQVTVGAELLGTGRAVRTATNDPALTPAAFGRAAGNMDRTAQRATGFSRATAARTLTPEQLKVVEDVRLDLERYSRASTDGKAIGSNTMQNIVGGNRLQDQVGPVGAAIVEPVSGIALLGLNQMRKAYGEKVAGIVQEAMLDPSRAAEILATLPPSQRAAIVRQAAQFIPRIGGATGITAPTVE